MPCGGKPAWPQPRHASAAWPWRSRAQGAQADGQPRRARAQAQQAFVAWQVALGQRCEARRRAAERARTRAQMALCWTLWVQESRLRRLSRAHAARKRSARRVPMAGGPPRTVLPARAWSLFWAGVEGIWWLVPGLRRLGVAGRGGPGLWGSYRARFQLCTPSCGTRSGTSNFKGQRKITDLLCGVAQRLEITNVNRARRRHSRYSVNGVLVRTGEAECSWQDCPSSGRDACLCRVIFCRPV